MWLDECGPLLTQMGHGADVTALVSSLHTHAWFVLPGDEQAIVTRTGGRQGCKLGALVFNLIYSVALKRLRVRLQKKGILLRVTVHERHAPFWTNLGAVPN